MTRVDPVQWFGHVARVCDSSLVRVAWMVVEPSLRPSAGRVQSYRVIAAELGVSVRTISRAVARLEGEGLLRIRGGIGRGRLQRYRLMLPPHAEGSTP